MFGHVSENLTQIFKNKIIPGANVGSSPSDYEQWYGVPFHKEKLTDEFLSSWLEYEKKDLI